MRLFHVLLATAIGLVKRMQHYKLKSLAIGQIHDSVLLDIVPEELQQIVEMYMDSQDDVRKMWPWLIYPIGAEADVSKVGGNWCDMESIGLFYTCRHKEFLLLMKIQQNQKKSVKITCFNPKMWCI